MTLFYLTLIFLICIVCYYVIYLNIYDHDILFTVILNFIFLSVLPIYYFYFEDLIYSLIFGFLLWFSSYKLNLEIKEGLNKLALYPLLYYFLTSFILGFILNNILT